MTTEEYLSKPEKYRHQAQVYLKLARHMHRKGNSAAYAKYSKKHGEALRKSHIWETRLRQAISSLSCEDEKMTLELKYLQCMTLDEIGEIIGYSRRHVHRILKRGRENLFKR